MQIVSETKFIWSMKETNCMFLKTVMMADENGEFEYSMKSSVLWQYKRKEAPLSINGIMCYQLFTSPQIAYKVTGRWRKTKFITVILERVSSNLAIFIVSQMKDVHPITSLLSFEKCLHSCFRINPLLCRASCCSSEWIICLEKSF